MRQGEESALNGEDTALAALASEKYSQAVEDSLEVAHKQQTDITVGSHVRQAFQQVGQFVNRSLVSGGTQRGACSKTSCNLPVRRASSLWLLRSAVPFQQSSAVGPGLWSKAACWWLTSRVAILPWTLSVSRRISRVTLCGAGACSQCSQVC